MKILIAGASGSTGTKLVEQLLHQNHEVRVIVRSQNKLAESWKNNDSLEIINASLLDLSDEQLRHYTEGCDAIVSCLGHNLTWKGIYGQPRKLVTEATHRLCEAAIANNSKLPMKYILMNTTGNRNKDLQEQVSTTEKFVVGLIRLVLPPHVDNEMAAEYLRTEIGQNNDNIEWVTVRPDGLIDEDTVTAYDIYPSPTTSAIFKPGKTSRINVGHFMAQLISDANLWSKWKGKMPVIYNSSSLV